MLYRLSYVSGKRMERVAGIEPASSAWKAEVLPLNYTRPVTLTIQVSRLLSPATPLYICRPTYIERNKLVVGEGFEPSKAEPSDLQSDPFDRLGIPPCKKREIFPHHAPKSMTLTNSFNISGLDSEMD